jgi:hypothetical protein
VKSKTIASIDNPKLGVEMLLIDKTLALLDVLYCCKTWSVTQREEHKFRVFE